MVSVHEFGKAPGASGTWQFPFPATAHSAGTAVGKMTANRLCLLVAVWIVLTSTGSFWQVFAKDQAGSRHVWMFSASLALAFTGLNLFLLRILAPGRALRWMLSVVLVVTALDSWFMDSFGVAIDTDMLRNVLETDVAEARDFIGLPMFWRLLWQAGIPIAFVWWARLPHSNWLRSTREYFLGALAGLALLFGSALPAYSNYASFFRNDEAARYLIAPANLVTASLSLVHKAVQSRKPFVKVGEDAHRTVVAGRKPLLTVFVVGETARAANFSLGGYGQNTNPRLSQRDVFYFGDVRSCGTSTAVSVPCMFSVLPRGEFDLSEARRTDSVLDIMQRAGIAVTWVENQVSCKGVCDRVPLRRGNEFHPESCKDGECLDDAMLFALADLLPQVTTDAAIFLHTMGSHGPTYHHRVTPEHEVFQPTCATEHIETCTDVQIVNSYDNSIVYTDYILDSLIQQLVAQQDRFDAVLVYVSDHGESLGEGGLYLHGQPYLIAPDVQKQVPMLLWFSADAPARLALDTGCLRKRLQEPVSHDHIAHTLMGLNDVKTSVYRPNLDLLERCRMQASS